jgi:hypothetical protein
MTSIEELGAATGSTFQGRALMSTNAVNLFDHKLIVPAIADAFRKL